MTIFGYNAKSSGSFIDGELVRCIFLSRTYPNKYLKDKLAQQEIENKIVEETGLSPRNVQYSHKDGGVAWHYAVIGKVNEDTGEIISTCHTDDMGRISLPEYSIFGTYNQFTPEFILENNLGFTNIIKGGSAKRFRGNRNILISQHFPGTLPEKDWTTGMTADKLNEDNRNDYPLLWTREQFRLAEWESIIHTWKQNDEITALGKLEDMIASRLLLYNIRNPSNVLSYIKPKKGLSFFAKFTRSGKFFDIRGFEWNKDTTTYDYYSQGTEEPMDEDITLAEDLLSLKLESEQKSVVNHDTAIVSDDEEDEIPF